MRTWHSGRWIRAVAVIALVVVAATAVLAAQRFGRRGYDRPNFAEAEAVPYDGRFTFLRLRYRMGGFGGGGDFGRRGLPPWAHDYPRAERNFSKILGEITAIRPFDGPTGGRILDLGDPELFKYPVAYMSEPGFWTMTDEEAEALRAYITKGGFLIFDDFRGRHWYNFEEQLRRVLPDARPVMLDATHPIFHAFFEIDSLAFVQFYGRGDQPEFYGVFEENDPARRLLAIANYNNDIGEFWEYSDTGFAPIELSNEAYKLGVNYVVYGMTH